MDSFSVKTLFLGSLVAALSQTADAADYGTYDYKKYTAPIKDRVQKTSYTPSYNKYTIKAKYGSTYNPYDSRTFSSYFR